MFHVEPYFLFSLPLLLLSLPCGAQSAFSHAQSQSNQWFLIEAAGLFWIIAELFILSMVIYARRYLSQLHTDASPPISFVRYLRPAIAVSALLVAVTVGLWMAIGPLEGAVRKAAADPGRSLTVAIADAYRPRLYLHLAIWSSFISFWVILECAIVYHGYRSYRILARLLTEEHT